MKITILGSGTCVNQLNDLPSHFPPAYLIEWENEKILFDCSEGVRFRIEKIGQKYTSINHIAISHSHPDHNALIQFIQAKYVNYFWSNLPNEDLYVYCPDYIKNNFETLWSVYNPDIEKPWEVVKLVGMSQVNNNQKIGSAVLTAFKAFHGFGKTDALCFRLETPEGVFAYSGDTGDCDGVRKAAENADFFICEASARIGDEKSSSYYGHLNPYQAGEIAKASKVKKLILVHYSGLDSEKEMVKEARKAGFEEEISIAQDFQILLPDSYYK